MFSDGVFILFEFQIWIKCKYNIWIFYHNVVPKLGIHTISFSNNKNINNNYYYFLLLFFIIIFQRGRRRRRRCFINNDNTVVFVILSCCGDDWFMTPSSNYQRQHSIKTINRKYNLSVLSPVTKLLTWFGVVPYRNL